MRNLYCALWIETCLHKNGVWRVPSDTSLYTCTVHQHSSLPNSLRNSSNQYFNICIQYTKRECGNSCKLLGKLEYWCTVQAQGLVLLGTSSDWSGLYRYSLYGLWSHKAFEFWLPIGQPWKGFSQWEARIWTLCGTVNHRNYNDKDQTNSEDFGKSGR